MTEGLLAVQARIGQIQSRFSPPAPSRAGAGSGDFATALATAQSVLPGLGSDEGAAGAGFPDLSALGQLSGLPGLSGLGGLTTSGASARAWGASDRFGAGTAESAVIAAAEQYLGVPYRWGGTDPDSGLDCSGFVQRVYDDVGIELPRVSRDQATAGRPVASLEEARPGDLVAFGSPVDHIGIYIGDGQMLVAPRSGDVVKRQDIYRTPTAIRRVLPDAPGSTGLADRIGRAPGFAAPTSRVPGGEQFAAAFRAAEAAHGLPAGLLRAVAAAESGFNPSATSRAGAQGLMQLMPATARALGVDPLVPEQAIDGAARLLAGQLERFGSVDLALAAYNAGGPAVARAGGIPPYPETVAYVARVRSLLTGVAA